MYAAEKVRVPVLLIVGEKDDRTPVWMSQEVFNRLDTSKELWIVPGAGHGGIEAPEFTNYPEFFVRIVSFFQRCLLT